jgi:spectinomycin phosphotransferase
MAIGHDLNAAVYEAIATDGTAYFLKVRFGPAHEAGLLAPRSLRDRGVPNILAPLPARSGRLWGSLAGDKAISLVLYPYLHGQNAMLAGLSAEQWRVFGATLRAVHDSGLEESFRDRLRVETFALPSAALVPRLLALAAETAFASAAAKEFAAFWGEHAERIRQMLARAETLGRALQCKAFDHVLCHSDIHAANILVGDDGRIHLIDWDDPIVAPRERDLLFVAGSRIARAVTPSEEECFFAGYGSVAIDPDALVYYRYERIIEDLGEFGKSVFLDRCLSEEARRAEAALAMGFFAPGGDIDRAEMVNLPRRSLASS